ncbi:hypothetical protein AB6A40_009478 [Gnathostoma spinigerum]|uniref:Uncharacterized protein n=1 Tax=Gnathostoma spinigerum TaxID=75299 RepID=A0ABD6ES30_9BILA
MLFLNPHPTNSEVMKFEGSSTTSSFCTDHCDITKAVLSTVFVYVVSSLFSIILLYPLSLITMLFPTITLVYTIYILRGTNRQYLWPCLVGGVRHCHSHCTI